MASRLGYLLTDPDASARLQTAMWAGTHPDAESVAPLVERCGVEPDFFVRDMLTWALTRHPDELTVPLLLRELDSPLQQARSQALHTLSKIADPSTWPAVSGALLHDRDDEVARTAWRAAIAVVPEGAEDGLAADLVLELGRGDLELQRSLSRALVALEVAARPLLGDAAMTGSARRRAHAAATLRLLEDPDGALVPDAAAATRIALGDDREL